MRTLVTLALLVFSASFAQAQVQTPAAAAATVQAPVVPERAPRFEVAEPVRVDARQLLLEENSNAALQPDRSSFWWIVVAVIVGGVILLAALG